MCLGAKFHAPQDTNDFDFDALTETAGRRANIDGFTSDKFKLSSAEHFAEEMDRETFKMMIPSCTCACRIQI